MPDDPRIFLQKSRGQEPAHAKAESSVAVADGDDPRKFLQRSRGTEAPEQKEEAPGPQGIGERNLEFAKGMGKSAGRSALGMATTGMLPTLARSASSTINKGISAAEQYLEPKNKEQKYGGYAETGAELAAVGIEAGKGLYGLVKGLTKHLPETSGILDKLGPELFKRKFPMLGRIFSQAAPEEAAEANRALREAQKIAAKEAQQVEKAQRIDTLLKRSGVTHGEVRISGEKLDDVPLSEINKRIHKLRGNRATELTEAHRFGESRQKPLNSLDSKTVRNVEEYEHHPTTAGQGDAAQEAAKYAEQASSSGPDYREAQKTVVRGNKGKFTKGGNVPDISAYEPVPEGAPGHSGSKTRGKTPPEEEHDFVER